MGNFSSCTAGLDLVSSSTAAAAAAAALAVHTSTATSSSISTAPHVARVLLIDGSVLKFRAPIKVIKLLLDYPNHLICPLDSLTPGLHSLSSLLPDEKLQLGRLYLLLPFKSNMHMQQSCIKSKSKPVTDQHIIKRDQKKDLSDLQEIREDQRTRLLPGDNSDASCANFYKKAGDVGAHDNNKLQSSALVQQGDQHACSKKKAAKCSTGQQKHHANMMKSEVGIQDCAELRKNIGDMGLQCRRRSTTAGSYGKLSEKRRGRREMRNRSTIMKEGISSEISPLCDTPELQRAYRSFLLRRSCSWTPRLQPILERR